MSWSRWAQDFKPAYQPTWMPTGLFQLENPTSFADNRDRDTMRCLRNDPTNTGRQSFTSRPRKSSEQDRSRDNTSNTHSDIHYLASMKNNDVIIFKCGSGVFPIYYPVLTIDRGQLKIGDLREDIAEKLCVRNPDDVMLYFNGMPLENDGMALRDLGVRSRSPRPIEIWVTCRDRRDGNSEGQNRFAQPYHQRNHAGKPSMSSASSPLISSGAKFPRSDKDANPTRNNHTAVNNTDHEVHPGNSSEDEGLLLRVAPRRGNVSVDRLESGNDVNVASPNSTVNVNSAPQHSNQSKHPVNEMGASRQGKSIRRGGKKNRNRDHTQHHHQNPTASSSTTSTSVNADLSNAQSVKQKKRLPFARDNFAIPTVNGMRKDGKRFGDLPCEEQLNMIEEFMETQVKVPYERFMEAVKNPEYKDERDAIELEYKRLGEILLTQVILKLDEVSTEGNSDARARRKNLVKTTQTLLATLDEAKEAYLKSSG